MSKTVQGIYRDGKIELLEQPAEDFKEGPVLVTFLDGEIDLRERAIDQDQAAELRAKLGRFVEEWDSPEMRMYDDYDASKSKS
jgi:hypothetical protein